MKKSVIFTVTNHISGDQRMQRIAQSLIDAGWDVEILGRKSRAETDLSDLPFRIKRLHCIFRRGKGFYIEFNIRLFFRLLFSPKSSVYGAVDLDTIVPIYWVARIKGSRCSFDAHELFTEVPEVYARKQVKQIWEWVAKNYMHRMDLRFTVSQSLSDYFGNYYNLDFTVVRNLAKYIPKSSCIKQKDFLLYQGALNRGRGLECLIEAMDSIDLELKIAGVGDIESDLKRLVSERGLSSKVEFLGLLTPENLKKLTEKAFLGYNLLANEGLSYYFSLANKTFDYMQAHIPVICSPFPEYLRISNNFGFIIFADLNAESISEKVNSVLKDNILYERLVEQARVAAEILTWEIESKLLVEKYNALNLNS